MDKVFPSPEEAIADIKDGAMIAIPGFFACGVPRALLQALIKKGVKKPDLDLRLRPAGRSFRRVKNPGKERPAQKSH